MGAFSLISAFAEPILNFMGAQSANEREDQLRKEDEWMRISQENRQYARNLEFWNLNNSYNDPANELKRLRGAGLNPLGMSFQNASMGSPSAVVPSSIQNGRPVHQPQVDLTGLRQLENLEAQTKNIQANTAKVNTETEINEIEKSYRDKMLSGQIELNGVNVIVGKQNVEESAKRIAQMDEQIKEISQRISNSIRELDLQADEINLHYLAEAFKQQIESRKLSLEEKAIAVQQYNATTQRMLADSNIEMNDANMYYLDLQGESIEISNDLHKAEADAKKRTMVFDQYLNSATNVLGALTDVFNIRNLIKGRSNTTSSVH